MSFNKLIGLFFLFVFLTACKKHKPEPTSSPSYGNGLVVLCEGLFQQNNSTISWISLSDHSVSNQTFYAVNNRYLGDTGNDLIQYGAKIYAAVNVSSTVEVLNASTLKSVAQIQMESSGIAKQPRFLEAYGGKVFTSCFDGYVDVIDTITNTVVNRIQVGLNPDIMKRIGDKLYVSNSGGLSYPTMDSTISVIDLNSELEINRLTVGLNPGDLEVDTEGELYAVIRGNYGSVPSKLVKIDPSTLQVSDVLMGALEVSPFGANRFLITYDTGNGNSIGVFNTLTDQWENGAFINTADITTVYEVVYIESKQRIYVLDAMGYTNSGYVRAYGIDGSFVESYHVGLNPTDLICLP